MRKGEGRGRGRQRGGVTDIVNSCLRPSNTSVWIFSLLLVFNKELTSQGQILKNIHYFFLFFVSPLSSSSCFGDC